MSPSNTSQAPSRFRFGIKFLLLITAVVCLVLSRYYPRIHVKATIDCGAKTVTESSTHAVVVRSPMILDGAISRMHELPEKHRNIEWIADKLVTDVRPNNFFELKAIGRPKERKQLEAIVRAIAAEYIAYMNQKRDKFREEAEELISTARDEAAGASSTSGSSDSASSASARVVKKALNNRLDEMRNEIQAILPPEAKIVEVASGWEFY